MEREGYFDSDSKFSEKRSGTPSFTEGERNALAKSRYDDSQMHLERGVIITVSENKRKADVKTRTKTYHDVPWASPMADFANATGIHFIPKIEEDPPKTVIMAVDKGKPRILAIEPRAKRRNEGSDRFDYSSGSIDDLKQGDVAIRADGTKFTGMVAKSSENKVKIFADRVAHMIFDGQKGKTKLNTDTFSVNTPSTNFYVEYNDETEDAGIGIEHMPTMQTPSPGSGGGNSSKNMLEVYVGSSSRSGQLQSITTININDAIKGTGGIIKNDLSVNVDSNINVTSGRQIHVKANQQLLLQAGQTPLQRSVLGETLLRKLQQLMQYIIAHTHTTGTGISSLPNNEASLKELNSTLVEILSPQVKNN